jgi:hypothetical protein
VRCDAPILCLIIYFTESSKQAASEVFLKDERELVRPSISIGIILRLSGRFDPSAETGTIFIRTCIYEQVDWRMMVEQPSIVCNFDLITFHGNAIVCKDLQLGLTAAPAKCNLAVLGIRDRYRKTGVICISVSDALCLMGEGSKGASFFIVQIGTGNGLQISR